jgi:tetratricopeptide (TPR) repeat protein
MNTNPKSPRTLAAALVIGAIVLAGCGSSASSSAKKLSTAKLLKQGVALELKGNLSGARTDFDIIISRNSALKNGYGAVAFYNLGVLDQRAKKIAAATTDYNRSIALAPQYEPALFNLAIIDSTTSPTTAESLYKRILTLQPTNSSAMYNLGLLYYVHNQKSEARTLLRKAISLTPSLVKKLPSYVTL